jgi:hypothetical protein
VFLLNYSICYITLLLQADCGVFDGGTLLDLLTDGHMG